MEDDRKSAASHDSFVALIGRVRNRDQEAAAELVRRYEPAVRRIVRVRLGDNRLRQYFDTMDICQSILGSFFVRMALGQYELETADELLKLLAAIARNKVTSHIRKERAERRDYRRVIPVDDVGALSADADPSPSKILEAKDLLTACMQRFTPEERLIAEMRSAGTEWAEIAVHVGGTPEAIRKRFSRAIEQVADWVDSQ